MPGSQTNVNKNDSTSKYVPLIFMPRERKSQQVETFKIDFMGKSQSQGSQPVPKGGVYAILSNGLNVELSKDYKTGSVFYPGPGAYTKATTDPLSNGDNFNSAQYLAQPKSDIPYAGENASTRSPEVKTFKSTVDEVGITASGGKYYQGDGTPIGDKQAEFLKNHQGEIKNGIYVEHDKDNIFTNGEADALLFGITTNPKLRKEAEDAGYRIVQKGQETGFEDVDKVLIKTTLNPILLPDTTAEEINKNNKDANISKKQLKRIQDRSYDTTRLSGDLK